MRFVMAVTALLVLALPKLGVAAQQPTAKEILNHVDDIYRGTSSHAVLTMKVKTIHWSRQMKLEMWSKGKDQSLIRILAPEKEEGTATLRSGNNIWNYLPKVNRVIKIPSSMMASSWMGSHFTNDDLVKESRMAQDYTFAITFRGARGGQKIIEITCTPKPTAAVVWGKLLVDVSAADHMPLSIRYYDEDMKLARTLTFSDVSTVGGRTIPTTMRMQPADKPDEHTVIHYQTVDFDLHVPDSMFTLRELQH